MDHLFEPVGVRVEDIGDAKVVDEIESLCMNCEQDGITRLFLTKIPYFREIILMSFYCPHCHYKNTEVQSAGEIQPLGSKFLLKMEVLADMERQLVKSDTAVIRIEELDLEIPPGRGRLTNIEGILSEVRTDLEQSQPIRKVEEPEIWMKIEKVTESLSKMISGDSFPYFISLSDPAGNSWIEPSPSDTAQNCVKSQFKRTPEQNASLGLADEDAIATEQSVGQETVTGTNDAVNKSMDDVDILSGQTYTMPCYCPGCSKQAKMNMQMVNIPYFKQVVISAVVCEHCGYRTSEVKTGGEVPTHGQRIWLDAANPSDLRRDILKSETCSLTVPECKVEVQPGTMGGRFTTVEGLLTQIRDDLRSNIYDVDDTTGTGGDSMQDQSKNNWAEFFATLDCAIRGDMKFTCILEDPLSNSYVQSMTAPEPDPSIRIENYTRTTEEDEELGISEMRTHMNADGNYVRESEAEDGNPPAASNDDLNSASIATKER